MKHILVTGGAGFIGTQTVIALLESRQYKVSVVDRNVTPYLRTLLPEDHIIEDDFVNMFMYDLSEYDTVIHLAACHEVERSVTDPFEFYENNITKTITFLKDVVDAGIREFIFSSSAGVYGNTLDATITEHTRRAPINPYATTKSVIEDILADMKRCYDMRYLCLRYFNAAGADPHCRHGYTQAIPTHLMPIVCRAAINKTPVTINGNTYETSDGTCVRDYVHVADLATAHVCAVDFVSTEQTVNVVNLGSERATVKEIIKYVSVAAGHKIETVIGPRRPGDPSTLICDSVVYNQFNWSPNYTLQDMVKHAYAWELTQTNKGAK